MAFHEIHHRILEVLRAHPEGVHLAGIRLELDLDSEEQGQLDRRLRQLRSEYEIPPYSRSTGYILKGRKSNSTTQTQISGAMRVRILHRDKRRCQMCGKTPAEDHIKLEVDHKVPQSWDGPTEDWNLWALCRECNGGKKDYFSSFDGDLMAEIQKHDSVHVRIGETLRLVGDSGAGAELLEFVADIRDWERRTRELRSIGWDYRTESRSIKGGHRRQTTYYLTQSAPWPDNPAAAIKAKESKSSG